MSTWLTSRIAAILLVFVAIPTEGQTGMPTPPLRYYSLRTSIGCIGGLYQGRHSFGEIGIGYGCLEDVHGYIFWGATGSIEANPWNNVYAAKISGIRSIPLVPLSFGISSVAFFQHGKYDQVIRPSLGIAYKYLHVTYSYDFTLGKRKIDERNGHMISLRYFLPVITLKEENWNRDVDGW